VEAKCTGWTKYYKGEITRVNSDDTYDITFEDGERKRGVRNEQSGRRGGKRGVNGGGKAGGKGGGTGKGGVTGKERIVVTAKSQLSFQRVTPQEASTFLLQVLGEPALGTRAQQSTHSFGLYVVDGTGDGGDGGDRGSGGGSGARGGAKTGVKPGAPKSKQHTSSTKTPPLNLIECEFYDSDDETTVLTVVGQKGASIQTTGGVHTEWGKCLSTSLVLG
jgi:hypothetical protein